MGLYCNQSGEKQLLVGIKLIAAYLCFALFGTKKITLCLGVCRFLYD